MRLSRFLPPVYRWCYHFSDISHQSLFQWNSSGNKFALNCVETWFDVSIDRLTFQRDWHADKCCHHLSKALRAFDRWKDDVSEWQCRSNSSHSHHVICSSIWLQTPRSSSDVTVLCPCFNQELSMSCYIYWWPYCNAPFSCYRDVHSPPGQAPLRQSPTAIPPYDLRVRHFVLNVIITSLPVIPVHAVSLKVPFSVPYCLSCTPPISVLLFHHSL